jgi:hypothetical protein
MVNRVLPVAALYCDTASARRDVRSRKIYARESPSRACAHSHSARPSCDSLLRRRFRCGDERSRRRCQTVRETSLRMGAICLRVARARGQLCRRQPHAARNGPLFASERALVCARLSLAAAAAVTFASWRCARAS